MLYHYFLPHFNIHHAVVSSFFTTFAKDCNRNNNKKPT